METIWTIVNNQDQKVVNYFEELYMHCIIERNKMPNCEIVKLWKDQTVLSNKLKNNENFNNVKLLSIKFKNDEILKGYFKQDKLTPEDYQYINAHYLRDYDHLSKAITIFDSYLNGISNDKRKFLSDNIVKVAIALFTAVATLLSVWLGFKLRSSSEDGTMQCPIFNSCNVYIIQASLNDSITEINTIHSINDNLLICKNK